MLAITKRSALIVLVFLSVGVTAMSIRNIGEVCLFSKMEGVLLINAKPAVNAKLIRTVDYSGPEVDQTTTDDQGRFQFPAILKQTIKKFLPQEFAVSQDITVMYNDVEYSLWSGVKRVPEENSESRGKPLVVQCDLSAEEQMIKVNNSPIFSLCKWDVEPDKKRGVF